MKSSQPVPPKGSLVVASSRKSIELTITCSAGALYGQLTIRRVTAGVAVTVRRVVRLLPAVSTLLQ